MSQLVATACDHCSGRHIGAGHVWVVTSGRMTQTRLDQIVAWHHRVNCSGFDGRKNTPAGPITKTDRIHHEAAIVGVFDALEHNGFTIVETP